MKRSATILAALLALAAAPAVHAQDKLPISVYTFPSLTNTTADIIKAKGLDAAHGFDFIPVAYGSAGAQYAGIAKGEIVGGVMSPFQLQVLRAQGVPVVAYATLILLSDIQVVTRNPAIRTFADLRGHSLAATTGLSEFQFMDIYAHKIGMDLRHDVSLVDAGTGLAQAQLQAGRVDAAILWEPSATEAMRTIPDLRVIERGDDAWKQVTGGPGWDVVLWLNADWMAAHPGVLPRLVAMFQDYEKVIETTPDEADAIITSGKYVSKGLPPGSIAEAIKARRLVADVHPTWDPATNKAIWQILQYGVEYKEIPALPAKAAVASSATGK